MEMPPRPEPLIDDPELEAMRQADRAIDVEMHPFSERNKRRWKIYVLGSIAWFPLMTFVFTPAGLGALWFQVIVAALYGTYLAFARPGGMSAALATVLAGVVTQAAAGTPTSGMEGLLFTLGLFMYGAIGYVIGMTQQARYMNGE